MPTFGLVTLELLLCSHTRRAIEPGADAAAARGVHEASVLRLPEVDRSSAEGGFAVNRKRIQGLMRRMGLEAIDRKPRLSPPGRQHKRYPYLLKGITVDRPDSA